MVASVEAGQAVEKVTDNGAVHNAGMVAVSIYLSGETDGVVSFLEDNGGSPRNVGEDYIEAYVPVPLLGQVSEQPGVLRVREIIPPQQTGPAATGDGEDIEITLPEKTELKYPNLGSMLDQLVAGVEHGEASTREAAEDAPVHQEGSVAVTIYLSGNVDGVVSFLEDNGGSPRNVSEDYIEAYVPVPLLGQVSEQFGVLRVREIVPAEEHQSTQRIAGQGPQAHGSPAWNQAGYSGQGVKVGVIDSFFGFNDFSSLMGTELPSTVQGRCYTDVGRFTQNVADCADALVGSAHGTWVAEAVMDIAPEASLYIVSPWSRGDTNSAVDWMVSQGVSVIVSAETSLFDGPGDGTSPFGDSPLRTVDRAVAGGIIWANVAGNGAQRTWFGPYSTVELGDSRFLKFDGSDIFNDMLLDAGDRIRVQLRWDDSWRGASRDFNLFVWDTCLTGGAVADPANNPGLATDCEVLLAAKDTLAGSATLDWSATVPIDQWEGVTVGGTGRRVTGLNLGDKGLTGRIPAELGSLIYLETLYLGFNELAGPIPGELGNLSNLETLYLGFNELAGPIPAELGSLSNLETLYLGFNELAGPIPAELGSLSNLESLNLSSNELTGIPGELGNLPNLETLYLGFNELAGPIPGELGNLSNLETLYLGFNELAGPIPAELASLSNLKSLNLSNNRLTGTIPAELGSLSNLESLNLSSNELTGIPGELGNLPNLETLYLGFNELAGPIPGELGNLSNLETLYLGFNELAGPIPAELGSLSNLKSLNLSNNRLTGTIPAELGSLANLERLSLSQNMLTGCVPEAWRDIAESDVLELGLPFCAVSLGTAPVFSDSEGNPITEAVRSVVENTPAGENVGAPVTAMDADNDTLTYSLGGTDMASFDIDPSTGQLMTKAALDYEAKASYVVTVTASDSGGLSDSIDVTITVTNVDEMGEVTLWASATDALTMAPQVGETITGAVMDPDNPDDDATVESWQWARTMDDMDSRDMDSWMPITGATNAAYMVTEGDTGYYLRVMATYTDAVGTDMAMEYSPATMMVTTMMTVPMFESETAARVVAENTAAGMNIGDPVTAMDADDDTLIYALGGTDAASFGINAATGQLMTKAALDYETKATYSVTVTASDSGGLSDSIDVTITVTDVDEDVAPVDPLVDKYDANENGEIERAEVFAAIDDYLDGGADAPTRADVFKLIEFYLGD